MKSPSTFRPNRQDFCGASGSVHSRHRSHPKDRTNTCGCLSEGRAGARSDTEELEQSRLAGEGAAQKKSRGSPAPAAAMLAMQGVLRFAGETGPPLHKKNATSQRHWNGSHLYAPPPQHPAHAPVPPSLEKKPKKNKTKRSINKAIFVSNHCVPCCCRVHEL